MSTVKDLTTKDYAEEDDLFFFETDHLALKGNVDYSELLKTLVLLQSQRLQAIKDYEEVAQLQKTALDDPVSFIERLKTGEKIAPEMVKVTEVPSVNWDKYAVKPPPNLLQQLDAEDWNGDTINADTLKEKDVNTFNKAWSVDEQKRLEELLIKYPPEPVEMKRFKKIASALGTRTTAQVTTRVQKYFLKLAKLGLPIPGRIPKSLSEKFRKCHPHQRFNHLLLRPSTFFPEFDIPVKMDDTEIAPGPSNNDNSNFSFDSAEEKPSNYLLSTNVPYLEQNYYSQSDDISKANTAKIRINFLQQIRIIKVLEEKTEERDLYRHSEYTCDYCSEEPIIGTRWHCDTCNNSESVDYCTDCMISQMLSSNPHDILHKFVTIGAPINNTESAQEEKSLINEKSGENQKITSDSESSDVDIYQFGMTVRQYDSNQSGTDIDNNEQNGAENESDGSENQDDTVENVQTYEGDELIDYNKHFIKRECVE